MKEVTMFILEHCPHCRKARGFMDELFREHPEYAKVPLKVIDEGKEPEVAAKFSYYYVPTFYVEGKKLMEGVPTKDAVAAVFAAAIGRQAE